jgi:redox-sensitive bicupin YhaK (pirin superfamily)/predicted CoA-binding protein
MHTNPPDAALRALLTEVTTIAMVGASSNPERPSYRIFRQLLDAGYRVFPVNPRETEVHGQRAYASLAEVPASIDIVDVFRAAAETPAIAREAVAVGARALWLQLGIANDEAAAIAGAAGLTVIMDACIGATHHRLALPRRAMRRLARVITPPPAAPGFIGAGHTAVEVLAPAALEASDPFVLLMDDRLEIPRRRQIGGPHPHAGLETVTLLVEGTVRDRDEGALTAGDALWMTAGRGIIHNEAVEAEGRSRILQLWVTLSAADRAAEPRFEVIRAATLPVRRERGVEARLYSGTTGRLVSPTKNHVAVTLVEFRLEPGATVDQVLPRSYNGFVYVLEGALTGPDPVGTEQTGWLDREGTDGPSVLRLVAGDRGARVVLYAGEPTRTRSVHHGPFVADSEQQLMAMFQDYRAGRFVRMSELAHPR